MKKKLIALLLLLCLILSFWGCTSSKSQDGSASTESNSYFRITFIAVGQGDSALIECDGRYMLIDGGGDATAGNAIADVLDKRVTSKCLDILAISHLHTDHYDGLTTALKEIQKVRMAISNATDSRTKEFEKLKNKLLPKLPLGYRKIKTPSAETKYELGSATIEVIDNYNKSDNDSLVLLVTYGKTRFLFTGDIERQGQLRVIQALEKKQNFDGESLIKMPHHGAYNDKSGLPENALYRLFNTYDPQYFIISAGIGNIYNHPHQDTIQLIKNKLESDHLKWDNHVFETSKCGNIVIESNGIQIRRK